MPFRHGPSSKIGVKPDGTHCKPAVNEDCELIVDDGGGPTPLWNRGENSGSTSEVTVASITLQNSKTYKELEFIVSSMRNSLFQFIWSNNGAETILADALTQPGLPTVEDELNKIRFVSGASGAQTLIVRGKNLQVESTLRATVAIGETD